MVTKLVQIQMEYILRQYVISGAVCDFKKQVFIMLSGRCCVIMWVVLLGDFCYSGPWSQFVRMFFSWSYRPPGKIHKSHIFLNQAA